MSERISIPHSPASFEKTMEAFSAGKMEEVDAYARYGYKEERKFERELAEKIGVPDSAILNSGMAAIHTAIEAEELIPGNVILCSQDVYDCTRDLYKDLEKSGIKVHIFDLENIDDLEKMMKSLNPSCVIFESVANSETMTMANLPRILDTAEKINREREKITPASLLAKRIETRFNKKYPASALEGDIVGRILKTIEEYQKTEKEKKAQLETEEDLGFHSIVRDIEARTVGKSRREIISDLADLVNYVTKQDVGKLSLIIDNTLPSHELYNPLKEIPGESLTPVTIVESGTKHYQLGQDKVTLGIAYSRNPEKIENIKKMRTRIGTYLQPNSLGEIPADSLTLMHEKMDRHAKNALALAKELKGLGLDVFHPNLETHPDQQLANQVSPKGIVTLFYVEPKNITPSDLAQKLYTVSNKGITVGASFGHPTTWVLPEGKTLRIAVGSDTPEEFEKVIKWFREALTTNEEA